ncbi:recombinase family protein [Klugiella xanthotipulae]|uniref:DNA invertase Pin-like site-specific DNA recombinase n=1 Tax=Klugiella xanthotipulae TaxID=244735 RepID=A0A543HS08_9MICO|nr:DNA invertase Pin-like site-specific DNA recombinase [Klugiella xanthotipulae]
MLTQSLLTPSTTIAEAQLSERDLASAVSYLRVSTKEQAEKGGKAEGFSIPAQRAANQKKAAQIGASVIEEFVDAGESAKKADRPALQEMIRYVKTHRVKYCIVHKVDRLARNRADDVAIHYALQEAGVTLVSATENIDETPSGMLLHGIMSTIAEFYSRNLATEVVKGMTQKAMSGGTPTKAPLGYLNTLERDKLGREVRSVATDPERAPLVAWAFQAYASGNYSLSELQKELALKGLTTLPTPKRPSRAVPVSSLHRMLRSPYYKGDVVYKSVRYDGEHHRLVEPEVWLAVQSVLSAHNLSGDRTQRHDHYLKGTVFCGSCDSRLMINHARSGSGTIYPYFVCSGRHQRTTNCTQKALHATDIENLVTNYYKNIHIPRETVDVLRESLNFELDRLTAAAGTEAAELSTRRTKNLAEQDRLLNAHLADAITLEQFTAKQNTLRAELDTIDSRLAEHHNDYAEARLHINDCLELAADISRIYNGCDDHTRRLCNQAFFEKIYIDENHTIRPEFATPFDTVLNQEKTKAAHEWSTQRAATSNESEVPTPSIWLQVGTSNIRCPRLDSNQRPTD